jgi:hypothetical protein
LGSSCLAEQTAAAAAAAAAPRLLQGKLCDVLGFPVSL